MVHGRYNELVFMGFKKPTFTSPRALSPLYHLKFVNNLFLRSSLLSHYLGFLEGAKPYPSWYIMTKKNMGITNKHIQVALL